MQVVIDIRKIDEEEYELIIGNDDKKLSFDDIVQLYYLTYHLVMEYQKKD